MAQAEGEGSTTDPGSAAPTGTDGEQPPNGALQPIRALLASAALPKNEALPPNKASPADTEVTVPAAPGPAATAVDAPVAASQAPPTSGPATTAVHFLATDTPLPGILRFGAAAKDGERAALALAPTPLPTAAENAPNALPAETTPRVAQAAATPVAAAPRPRTPCPACSFESEDPSWCDRCGAELHPAQLEAAPARPREPILPGTVLGASPRSLVLEEVLHETPPRVLWRAHVIETGQQLEVLECPPGDELRPMPASLATVLRLPLWAETHHGRFWRAYAPETGRPLDELLRRAQPLEVCIDVTLAVARAFAELHAAGHAALGLHESQVRLQGVGARLCWEGPFPAFTEATALRAPVRGFSAPEAYGRGEGRVTPASDVFVLTMLLYYLATGAPRIEEVAESGVELPALRDWRPDIPPGLEGVVRRGTARLGSRRTPDLAAFCNELALARTELTRRQSTPYTRLEHRLAVDGHIGINKQKQRPINEDATFTRADGLLAKSLVLVADGVTHATLGTGNEASALVVAAAAERWPRLLHSRLADGEMPPRVAENVLGSLARAANTAIALRATELTVEPAPAASEVMASTLVLALLDGNRLHLLNLGDSRAYLFARGELERLTADHDVRHELLRERRSLFEVTGTRGGSQLTRFVGRMERREGAWQAVDPAPDFHHLTLLPGDRLLLCSDGVSDYVGGTEAEADAAIARALGEHRDPARAAFELVVLANRGGGGDNITCIVVDVLEPDRQ